MTTDVIYIYILSKWYDNFDVNLDKAADEEPNITNKKTTISIYGVEIYDPVSKICHK
jgi:hypothetical protein